MAAIRSKLTAQGQISVPAKIRQRLGLEPGAVIEWDTAGAEVIVRRAGVHNSEELHKRLFSEPPEPISVEKIKDGIRKHVRKRHEGR